MPNKNSLQHTICSMLIGTRILSPSFLHGVSTKHQLWWQNKHFQVPHTSHKAVGGLVANLCSALATPRTVAHTALFVHGIFQVRIPGKKMGCHFLLYRIFPTQGFPTMIPALQADSLPQATWEVHLIRWDTCNIYGPGPGRQSQEERAVPDSPWEELQVRSYTQRSRRLGAYATITLDVAEGSRFVSLAGVHGKFLLDGSLVMSHLQNFVICPGMRS